MPNLPESTSTKKSYGNIKAGPGGKSREMAEFWLDQISAIDKANAKWAKQADMIVRRYRDERSKSEMDGARRFNAIWANTKILMSALYAKPPIPIAERRFLQHDPVGRRSATILERSMRNEIENNQLHPSIKRAVLDYLLVGRGAVWVRYEPEIGEGDSLPIYSDGSMEDDLVKIEGDEDIDSEEAEKLDDTGEQLLSEQAPVDYIPWKDLYLFPVRARTWNEVQAVGKKVYISKQEAVDRFGEKVGRAMKADMSPTEDRRRVNGTDYPSAYQDMTEKSILVYEIWNKLDRKLYYVCSGYDFLCNILEDPLKLKDFFPIPEVISSTLTNDTMIPVPDYIEYQDQAIQIDELTQRLAMLTKACKVAGTYDGGNGALKRLLTEGVENDLIPVDSWAIFAEKGGVQGGISFLPIDEIQKVIETLTKVRQNLMQDMDQITGLSDVVRGTTDSRETLGGIRLKNNNAGTRLSDRQGEVAAFARNTIAIVAEIAAKHFSDKKLIESSGILYDDEMQPETIQAEYDDLMSKGPATAPVQPKPQMGHGQSPLGLPAPGAPQPQMPMGGAPMGAGGQSNVLPFPGGQQPPPMGGMMGQQPPTPLMPMQPQLPQFDPNQIIEQRLSKAIALLRKDIPRGYRIDIETDSTIFGDAQQDRQDATQFIAEGTKFLTAAAQVGQQLPASIPLLGRMLQWGARKMRVGRDLESAIDHFVQTMEKKSKEMEKNPQPSPEQIEAQQSQQEGQLKIEAIKMTNQSQMQKLAAEQKAQEQNDQRDAQKQAADDQREMQMTQMEMQKTQEEMRLDIDAKRQEHAMKMQEMQANMNKAQMEHQQDIHAMTTEAALKEREHKNKLEATTHDKKQDQAQHQNKMKEIKITAQEKDKARKDKAKDKKRA